MLNNGTFHEESRSSFDGDEIRVRSFRASDHPDVMRLYYAGVLAGRIDPWDRTDDLHDIDATYFRREQDHFWVADANGRVIGTAAISEDNVWVAHLRRLRVERGWQDDDRVAIRLIRAAIYHARSYGCLKLVFHTSLDSASAVELLRRLGFQFASIRDMGSRHLIEFYDDLYANVCPPDQEGGGAWGQVSS